MDLTRPAPDKGPDKGPDKAPNEAPDEAPDKAPGGAWTGARGPAARVSPVTRSSGPVFEYRSTGFG